MKSDRDNRKRTGLRRACARRSQVAPSRYPALPEAVFSSLEEMHSERLAVVGQSWVDQIVPLPLDICAFVSKPNLVHFFLKSRPIQNFRSIYLWLNKSAEFI